MKLVDIGDGTYVNPEHVSSVVEVPPRMGAGETYVILSMLSGDEVRAPSWTTLAAVIEILKDDE